MSEEEVIAAGGLLLQVVGFSGTVDNRSLLPLQVQVQDTTDLSIRGTDGRMTSTLLLPGKCTFVNLTDQPSVSMHASMSVSMQVLQFAIDHGANAIIDAGVSVNIKLLHMPVNGLQAKHICYQK